MLKKKIVFLLGPTGVGKSAAAINLAKKINAGIVSCDSMQVYRKMNIITSKVTPAQAKEVKHYLLNIVDPGKEYNAAQYRRDALAACDKIFRQGKIPLFVGGTGLYYSAVVDGLFPAIPRDRRIRARLEKQAKEKGGSYLFRKLLRIDCDAAGRIHPHDTRRVIRALEVYLKTGRRISELQREREGLGKEYLVAALGLDLERNLLYRRIDERVDAMFERGLVCEVKKLLKDRLSLTARHSIGIPELKGYFAGRYDLQEARRLIKRNSRHYAKRQLTWFRNDGRVRWIEVGDKDSPEKVAARSYRALRSLGGEWKKRF
ncbi:MAG: tRNA (adenosine(37)-N6)-dimethylallyltransferase MiaA [Candidatus Omnitrophica bacterium]|nr:tRNA (adenosine(37)-N6)-dimethylallyltransferase MiaA [Candidatus Omnitrophota bacterium]